MSPWRPFAFKPLQHQNQSQVYKPVGSWAFPSNISHRDPGSGTVSGRVFRCLFMLFPAYRRSSATLGQYYSNSFQRVRNSTREVQSISLAWYLSLLRLGAPFNHCGSVTYYLGWPSLPVPSLKEGRILLKFVFQTVWADFLLSWNLRKTCWRRAGSVSQW